MKLKLATVGAAIIAVLAAWHLTSRRSAVLEEKPKEYKGIKSEGQKDLAKPAPSDGTVLVTAAQVEAMRSKKRAADNVPAEKEVSQDPVKERRKHAGEMFRAGRMEEALQGFLWCYRNTDRVRGQGQRKRFIQLIANVGKKYPPARTTLMQLRDEAQQAIATNPADRYSMSDLAALNDYLGDKDLNLQAFNALLRGSPGRQIFGQYIFDDLVRTQRYTEAVEIQDVPSILAEVDGWKEKHEYFPRPSDQAKMIGIFANHLEVLAGAGRIEDARRVANRMLEFNDSAAMRELIAVHAARAGHPDLSAPTPTQ